AGRDLWAQAKGEHGATALRLAEMVFLLGKTIETRIIHLFHQGMLIEPLSDPLGVFLCTTDAYIQRFHPSDQKPAIERRRHTPHRILCETNTRRQSRVRCHYQTHDEITVSAQIFRRTMNNDVSTQRERVLEPRSHKGIVYDNDRSACVRQL